MRKVGTILILLMFLSIIGLPISHALTLDMQEDEEMALVGLFFLLALTGTNSTTIYETPEMTIAYIHLNVSNIDPMFIIETSNYNISSKLDFYIIKEGITTKFATIGINMTSMMVWLDYPTPDMSSWNYYEFQLSKEAGG